MRGPLVSTVLTLLLVVPVGCAPGELPTPTPERVRELVREAFPEAGVDVSNVERLEREVRAAVELDGADMVMVLEAGEDAWALTGVEQGEVSYTIEELGRIRTTVDRMDSVHDALARHRADHGAFPALDDLVGLRELVPDYLDDESAFTDGWGNVLHYRVQGEDYTLTSSGPDGEPSTSDDVILVTGRFGQDH